MPINWEIQDEPPLANVHAVGVCELGEWVTVIHRLATDPRLTADMPVLVDARGLDAPPEVGAGTILAGACAALIPKHPLALVMAAGASYGVARQVAILLGDDRVHAFTDLDDAVAWLSKRSGRQPDSQ